MGWETWAIYCDDMFRRVRESIRLLKSSGEKEQSRLKTDATTESNAREWGKSAVTCFLNAARSYTEEEKNKKMIARALVVLSMDDNTGEIGTTFGRLVEMVDASYFKFCIPQLLTVGNECGWWWCWCMPKKKRGDRHPFFVPERPPT